MTRSLTFRTSQIRSSLVYCVVGLVAAACGAPQTAPGGSGGGATTTPMGGTGTGLGGSNNPGGGTTAVGSGGTSNGGTSVVNPQGGNVGVGGAAPAGGTGGGNPVGGAATGGTAAGGGTGTATFSNYEMTGSWPNIPIAIATVPATLSYQKVVVHTRFLAESCSIADYNGDGNPDISSGRRWYEGPFTPGMVPVEHVFRDGHEDLPRIGMPRDEIDTGVSDDWADYPWDVNGDGNADIINIANCDVMDNLNPNPAPIIQSHATAFVYENPGPAMAGAGTNWAKHQLAGDIRHEQKGLVDVNGDGQPEVFGACKGCMPNNTKGYYANNWADPGGAWNYQAIVLGVDFPFGGTGWMHGLGFGDVNGDGKPDMLSREGAYIQPADTATAWTLMAVQLWDGDAAPQRGGSHMFTADFDGDGDMDIFSAMGAHHWGLAWYEQTTPGAFTQHQFMGTTAETGNYPNNAGIAFSEPHAAQVADMDGDGVPDVVVGKMRFAHPIAENDPDAQGTCAAPGEGCSYDAQGKCTGAGDSCNYLVVFKGVRDTAGTSGAFHFEIHKVDAESGVGRQLSVGHANTDGKPDICIASKLGLYVFLGQ